ncbi:MAG: DUF3494 domain-containing protein [Methanomassiliicoccales archaeon]|nr:DUF3494 domain-containing protein [Methanomassiliicoccales archaeon]
MNLNTAGNYAILAESGISNTGTTTLITGDIAVSPVASTAITGFALVLDASGTFSTSAFVVGKVWAADYTAPTPTTLTTAVGDMTTAYNDAAGRTGPDFIDIGTAGDITTLTLTPGLYKWNTGVNVAAAGVTISGTASDVWIFQISGALTLASSAAVTLTGGAVSSNIFWQVAGGVTVGTNAAMKGIVMSATLIALQTGASLDGRALAQTAVTLDSNAVTAPGAVIPEFSQILIPLVGIVSVIAIFGRARKQKK